MTKVSDLRTRKFRNCANQTMGLKYCVMAIFVTSVIFVGSCDGQKLIESALDILRANGLDGNLIKSPVEIGPDGNAAEVKLNSLEGHSFAEYPLNRTALWMNYSAVTTYTGPMNEDFLNSISLFWLTSPPPSPRAHFAMAVLYIFMMSVGMFGNGLVLFMFMRCKSLRTPANMFVMNLAISDFLMMTEIPVAIHNSLNYGPILGSTVCQIYGFVGALSGTLSIATLTAIAVDRYNVIVYPLNPNRSTTYLKSRLIIVFCWLYSLLFSGLPLMDIGMSKYVPEGFLTCCSYDYLSSAQDSRIFIWVYFFFAWCLPFFLIAYCYFHILNVVVSANSIQSSKDKNKQEMKLAAVVFGVIGLWFLAWTPYAIVSLIGISGNEHILTPIASMLPAFFAKGGACLNPYLYAVNHPRFRTEFEKMFCAKRVAARGNFTTSVSRGQSRVAETNVDARRGTIDDSIDESTVDQ